MLSIFSLLAAVPLTMSFQTDIGKPAAEEVLLDLPGTLTVRVREARRDIPEDARFGNYLNFPLPDGTCPVLEAVWTGRCGRIGIPLGALKNPKGPHAVTLRRTRANWQLQVDERLDEDFLIDDWNWSGTNGLVVAPSVRELRASTDVVSFPDEPASRPITRPIQYWTPDDHNAWVGDVVIGWWGSRLHLFYLFDRRHHQSKDGQGGHQFAHLSTADLVHWNEHPMTVPIRDWWVSCGTGTPFQKDGRLCLAVGLHTSRFYPAAQGFPIGTAIATGDGSDATRFSFATNIVNAAQNLTVFNRPDGRFGCVTSFGGTKGIFVSRDLLDWELEDDRLPFRGDCPSIFFWKGESYLLQGFVRYARNASGRPGGFVDLTMTDDNFYDGLSVPMVTPWRGDRRLMAGWIEHPDGWGGWLCLRELVRFEDGNLGTRWPDEMMPPGEIRSFEVPAGDSLRVRYRTKDDPRSGLEFRLDTETARAQFADYANGPEWTDRQMTQAEVIRSLPSRMRDAWFVRPRTALAASYAVGGLRRLEKGGVVRICAWYDPKADCTLFDAEIAGCRTMVCRRRGRFAFDFKEVHDISAIPQQ